MRVELRIGTGTMLQLSEHDHGDKRASLKAARPQPISMSQSHAQSRLSAPNPSGDKSRNKHWGLPGRDSLADAFAPDRDIAILVLETAAADIALDRLFTLYIDRLGWRPVNRARTRHLPSRIVAPLGCPAGDRAPDCKPTKNADRRGRSRGEIP
jgi:hypothetical protein